MNPILHLDPDSWQARGMPNTSLRLVILPAVVRSNPPFGNRARLHGNRPAARQRAKLLLMAGEQ